MKTRLPFDCDCCDSFSRRDFIKTAATGAVVAAAGSVPLFRSDTLSAAEKAKLAQPETLVASLYKSLTEQQRESTCYAFDHPLRNKVDNNWHITKLRLGKDFTKDQQQMVKEIFIGLHSEEYAERVLAQVTHDSGKDGFGDVSIALFGTPGTGKFEFVLAGRHVTRRCDGDSVEGEAFGGPIFYGHAAQGFNEKADHPGNIYWYQALRANEVFKMLDGKQRERALLGDGREEKCNDTVKLSGKKEGLPGIAVRDLSKDQREHVRKVMADLLAPFRKMDVDEVMKLVEENGFDNLHMAFYKNEDIGGDGVWDVWQLEGPAMVWYFRGAPHVHTWVHVSE
ncbi:MAG: DUF3500 domain-containing protein, partial [Verrucomicrobia bacterium]|nr:DUF3500 domain-containing protein [Verrucomicrobiota bacterium]